MPEYFKDTDPSKLPLSKHKLAQVHEWSGRKVNFAPVTPPLLPSTTHRAWGVQWERHRLTPTRQNLYIASYCYNIEGMDQDAGSALLRELLDHVQKPKYRVTIEWQGVGDMIIWDNTSVMHRATGGSYEGKFRRDMRRTTVKDMSSTKYGLNGEGADWRVGLP